ncbi:MULTISPECIES: serine/threonine-protein kinase [unclassified Kitasatospora]|uniref:serine/threonine-protein kinase n=1 Tax=unclassified Kitasatospora TaxID=2633591 RepID=UPI0033E0984B
MRPRRESDPAEVGPYRVLAELGRGGMGRVLLGAAPDGRLVAVKQVHDRFAADDGFRARFRREAGASRRVSGAYTAAVMDADVDAPTPWLASVFVVGPSLGAAVEAAGPLPADAVHRLAVGLATALAEIHRAALIHRDLTPENVLLADDGVRVIDFGIARAAEEDAELTHTGGVIGSPAYMSPEQAEGRVLTPAADVFSLGAVLALALTGRSPFAGASTLQTLYNVVHTEPDLAAVPAATRPLLAACLAKDPAARPTPARLLELLGPVAPAARQWPPTVHALITAQQTAVDGLLADPQGAAPPRARTSEPTSYHLAAPGLTALATAVDTGSETDPPAPVPVVAAGTPPRRSRRTAALVTAGVVAAAGVGGYLWLRDANDPNGPAVPDKYVKAPACAEATGRLPLPAAERKQEEDHYVEQSSRAETDCYWYGSSVVSGTTYWDRNPSAIVRWMLQRSAGTSDNATQVQRKDFGDLAAGERRASGLGVGEEAYWGSVGNGTNCSLHVRDGNLRLSVDLGGKAHPADGCEAQAVTVARAALAAMPS